MHINLIEQHNEIHNAEHLFRVTTFSNIHKIESIKLYCNNYYELTIFCIAPNKYVINGNNFTRKYNSYSDENVFEIKNIVILYYCAGGVFHK